MDKGGRMGSTLHVHACWNKDCAADLRRDRREDLCLKNQTKTKITNKQKPTHTKVLPICNKNSLLAKKGWVLKDFLSVPSGKWPLGWFKNDYEYEVAAAWHVTGSTQHADSFNMPRNFSNEIDATSRGLGVWQGT